LPLPSFEPTDIAPVLPAYNRFGTGYVDMEVQASLPARNSSPMVAIVRK